MGSAASNVLPFPQIGRAINADDQGVYFAVHAKTGRVHSILRLDFEKEWYLHQLQPLGNELYAWHLMAEHANDPLVSMTQQEIAIYFDRPEFAEPEGAWQVLYNSRFGFGKFTPADTQQPTRYAIIPFNEAQMGMPVLLTKADEAAVEEAKQQLIQTLQAV